MEKLVGLIKQAQNILLTTHRQADGDGLGAQMALYFALLKTGKKVSVINIDETAPKYSFLPEIQKIQIFEKSPHLSEKYDLALVFDTNDERMIDPLFEELKKNKIKTVFIDHHPQLKLGPTPSSESYIQTTAASTGEIAYQLIQKLGILLDEKISICLYTSITFDTQLFRYVRSSPSSHLICAELLKYNFDALEVHQNLFSQQSVEKMRFISQALQSIEYHYLQQFALVKIKKEELEHHGLGIDDSRDVIDMIMNIKTLQAACLIREDSDENYKVSFRSKGSYKVVDIAERLGGGGHPSASGCFYKGPYHELRQKILDEFKDLLEGHSKTGS